MQHQQVFLREANMNQIYESLPSVFSFNNTLQKAYMFNWVPSGRGSWLLPDIFIVSIDAALLAIDAAIGEAGQGQLQWGGGGGLLSVTPKKDPLGDGFACFLLMPRVLHIDEKYR